MMWLWLYYQGRLKLNVFIWNVIWKFLQMWFWNFYYSIKTIQYHNTHSNIRENTNVQYALNLLKYIKINIQFYVPKVLNFNTCL